MLDSDATGKQGLVPILPWPKATLQVQAEDVNEPRKCKALWLVMAMTVIFLTSGRQPHQAFPAPFCWINS